MRSLQKLVSDNLATDTKLSRQGGGGGGWGVPNDGGEGGGDTEGAASESYQGGDWTNDTVSKFPRSVERRKRASPSKSVRQLILQGRKRKQKVNSPARIPGPSSRRWVLYLR